MRQHAVAAILVVVAAMSATAQQAQKPGQRPEPSSPAVDTGAPPTVPVRVQLVISKYKGEETRKSPA